MRITFLTFFLFTITCSFGQRNNEETPLLKYVDSIVGSHVTFISWYKKNDSIKINQFRIYNSKTKSYTDFFEGDIREKFPILLKGFTCKTQTPSSTSYRSNIYYFDFIDSIHFLNRTNIFYYRPTYFRRQIPPRELFT